MNTLHVEQNNITVNAGYKNTPSWTEQKYGRVHFSLLVSRLYFTLSINGVFSQGLDDEYINGGIFATLQIGDVIEVKIYECVEPDYEQKYMGTLTAFYTGIALEFEASNKKVRALVKSKNSALYQQKAKQK